MWRDRTLGSCLAVRLTSHLAARLAAHLAARLAAGLSRTVALRVDDRPVVVDKVIAPIVG